MLCNRLVVAGSQRNADGRLVNPHFNLGYAILPRRLYRGINEASDFGAGHGSLNLRSFA
jgi:hypothetical protein